MQLRIGLSLAALIALPLTSIACGSSTQDPSPSGGTGSSSGGSSSGLGGSSGSSGSSESSGGSGGSSGTSGGSSGTTSSSGGTSGGTSSSGGSSGSSSGTTSSSGESPDGGSSSGTGPCVKGQVKNNEVVMLGDSYMDIGNVGPTIMKDANNAMYRHYYLAASALNYGSGTFNIPYQFETMALMDTAVMNPTDIKVVIMDGGGNDVLINNSQCLTVAIGSDTGNSCHTAVDASVAKGLMLEQEMAAKGVQHIVYYFYPNLDPTVSGHTHANDWLDYSYPKGAADCCGTANVPASGDLSCRGNGAGTDCVWIDTRPEFVGHNDHTMGSAYWFQSDNIHPSQPGADAISAKVWAAMQKYCIAQ
jgi:hypothetical protein